MVSHQNNHRIMKWSKNARQVVVAVHRNEKSCVNHLNDPLEFFMDSNETIYMINLLGERLVQWEEST